jgi:TRAP-type C4-dicarboxylate transport system substrate-binding protein
MAQTRTPAKERNAMSRLLSMSQILARCAALAFVLLPLAASAEQTKLKLAFFSSDRESIYLALVKPFVDAVNADKGGLEIESYTSGRLGRSFAQQTQLLRDGVADIAFVNPNLEAGLFPDDTVMQMPGLFNDTREATLTYTRLATSGALKGYGDFLVIGAVGLLPSVINSGQPIASLDDFKNKRVRAASPTERDLFQALGMVPSLMAPNEIASALSGGSIDGASVVVQALFDFGISRVTRYHYFAPLGGIPLTLLMSRKKFDSLSAAAQEIIRKHSGEWLAKRFIDIDEPSSLAATEHLKSDSARKVIFPVQSDLDVIHAASRQVTEKWLLERPHNRELLAMVEAEIGKIRSTH